MPKVEKIEGGRHAPVALRVTRRKRRQLSKRRFQSPRVRIKCGCCDQALDILHDEKTFSVEQTLEINGIMGSIEQWRKVFGPILGFRLVRKIGSGTAEVSWISKIG